MAKPLKKDLAPIVVPTDLNDYCPDLATWASSWRGDDIDIVCGEQIVAVFTPFLIYLLAQGISRKTRNLHRDNLWLLGGEIIRDINETPKLRKRPAGELIRAVIDSVGGPLLHGITSEQEQRSFDSTCKKLNRFLAEQSDS
jgi:hypothetical protein